MIAGEVHFQTEVGDIRNKEAPDGPHDLPENQSFWRLVAAFTNTRI